jgi:hypothetical protein
MDQRDRALQASTGAFMDEVFLSMPANVRVSPAMLASPRKSFKGHPVNEGPTPASPTGLASSVSLFVNCVLGSGVVVLPYALSRCGLLLGMGALVAVAALTSESCVLLVACGESVGETSFQGLCRRALGKPGELCCSLFTMLFTLGGLVSYLLIVGDTVPQVVTALVGSTTITTSSAATWLLQSRDGDGVVAHGKYLVSVCTARHSLLQSHCPQPNSSHSSACGQRWIG